MTDEEPELKRLARLCSADLGKDVLPGDIYGFFTFGERFLKERFPDGDDVNDIIATLFKETRL
jgi:hypothetical protein